MKVSGFVLDTTEAKDRVVEWARRGWLARCYVQTEYWPHAEKNKAAFAQWKAELNPLGVGVYATVSGYEADTLPQRIAAIRAQCQPNGWCGNFESLMTMEGVDCKAIMAAFKPDPAVISYNLLAEQGAFDFRHWSLAGAEVHGQAYDPDGDSTKGPKPAEHVTSAFRPVICWGGGGGPAWWYRVKASGRWGWYWIVGMNQSSGEITMQRSDGRKLWADGRWVGHMEFQETRNVHDSTGVVGQVFGFAQYARIGYSLGTTRPISPAQLVELARGARAPGMAAVKKADLYTLENTTTEQIAALVTAL